MSLLVTTPKKVIQAMADKLADASAVGINLDAGSVSAVEHPQIPENSSATWEESNKKEAEEDPGFIERHLDAPSITRVAWRKCRLRSRCAC